MTTLNPVSGYSELNQFSDEDRRFILEKRTSDIVATVRSLDLEQWWEEPHTALKEKTPKEVLMVCPISESAVLLMNAAVHTARIASKIVIL